LVAANPVKSGCCRVTFQLDVSRPPRLILVVLVERGNTSTAEKSAGSSILGASLFRV
jgi:hypothetical protein